MANEKETKVKETKETKTTKKGGKKKETKNKDKMVNLKALFLEIGYSDSSWKSQKSANIKKITNESGSDTFMVTKGTAQEILSNIALSKSNYKNKALEIAKKGLDYIDGIYEIYEEEESTSSSKKTNKAELVEALKEIGHNINSPEKIEIILDGLVL